MALDFPDNADYTGNIILAQKRPEVSVIIPTYKRHHLVGRAVKSALNQTLQNIEVLVILDGPDSATIETLDRIEDPRLCVIELPHKSGANHARNTGINRAWGTWMAFLDDDDEWFPRKLEIQLNTARQSGYLYPIVSCRLIGRDGTNDYVWPRKLPGPNEHLSEYLLCRKEIFWGEGLIQSSTIFTSRELVKKISFRVNLLDHEDLDWVLRASTFEGASVEFVSESGPLAIWHIEKSRERMSNTTDWKYSLAWIQELRNLVTPRAYTSFLMTWISTFAARRGDWDAFPVLLREAFQKGRPTLVDMVVFLGNWLMPLKLQNRISTRVTKSDGF